MIKQILLILLGSFFLLNGFNHFFYSRILKEYAHKKGLIAPRMMVILSGIFLIAGGLSMITGLFITIGMIGLCVFLVVASFSIHKFWEERDREVKSSKR